MRHFVDNIELWLSAAGVAVILLIPRLGLASQDSYWAVMAVTALIVGVLHGGIFWLIRRRQRRLRATAIREIRQMLTDRVNNQLNVIIMHVSANESAESCETVEGVQAAVDDVTDLLDTLSEESLRGWQAHYADFLSRRHLRNTPARAMPSVSDGVRR
ncbi:MAG TPA: hypothetical protein DGD08_06585 [Gemmatimonas aurantiaca]|uniref:Uncharacterized protein n=2 Tax=Gemmatimonas aurantiaca TaxID=173480 RepID=C1A781_GEMAT|nr:hypothetical protein [Gemmatimonas aurantiaca]BAH38091.1 hypothetical protein GAU_1049 [Gemmatimonas aurantiaca T-27]HCT56865.1 hypothetical protein [Gemmatimonas aurantiaca]